MVYENGKIYALRSNKTDMIYVGSTINVLRKRLHGHKSAYKRWLKGKSSYYTSFELIKYDDCYIELIEYCECKTRAELNRREGQIIRKNKCINKDIPGRTRKEYYEEYNEKVRAIANKSNRKYYKKNKDIRLSYGKKYRENNKEKIRETLKKYYLENREKLIKMQKERDEKNKEYLNEKIECKCGSITTRKNKLRHLKTKKHKLYLFNSHNIFNHL